MGYNLFLDDIRQPEDVNWANLPQDVNWVVVRNYNQFTQEIQSHGVPDFVTFDHDLDISHYIDPQEIEEDMIFLERTGYDCAKWLVNHCIEHHIKFPKFVVHSMNPVGKTNIIKYIECALRNCQEL